MKLNTNLSSIQQTAIQKQEENDAFILFLQQLNRAEIDVSVRQLNAEIEPQIDCTQCGNCCKTLMINVTDEEAGRTSAHLNITRRTFDDTYLEKGNGTMMIMNQIPCAFLHKNTCSIYEHRFAGCREFPALGLPDFNLRLFTVMMHYDRCPIIFNVVEELKIVTSFTNH